MSTEKEQIRQLAEELLTAIDSCPGDVLMGSTSIKNSNKQPEKRKLNKDRFQRLLEDKWNKRYYSFQTHKA
ncbi:MAG: hypothetical protein ACTHJ5_13715 [Ilyomonas sp.]